MGHGRKMQVYGAAVHDKMRSILEWGMADGIPVSYTHLIIIAVVIEFGMNYPSLTKSYEAVLFSNSGELNEDGDLVYSQNMDKAVYVNKLKIKAETLEKNSYTVVATVVNDFGKTKSVEITDKAYPEFGYAYTNVREKVSKLQVIFTSPEKINVSEISYSNKANFNGYRMRCV